MPCNADTEANRLLESLLEGTNFPIPPADVSGPEYQLPVIGDIGNPIARLMNADLTSGTVDGTGTFDVLMRAYNAHLRKELEANRISGAEYTKVYIALTEAAMVQGVSFLLGKDQAYWQSITAQLQAQTAQVQLVESRVRMQMAKVELARIQNDAMTSQANYALTKMRLANEEIAYCIAKFQLDEMLPKQSEMLGYQMLGVRTDTDIKIYNLEQMLPRQFEQLGKQMDLLDEQILGEAQDTLTKTFNVEFMLPKQLEQITAQVDMLEAQAATQAVETQIRTYNLNSLLPAQLALTREQTEAQRGQTMDTRTDGMTPITGSIGKQKELYTQQITSYRRDAEVKASKLWVDAWITMKTIDEGLLPPTNFQNTTLDSILTSVKTANQI